MQHAIVLWKYLYRAHKHGHQCLQARAISLKTIQGRNNAKALKECLRDRRRGLETSDNVYSVL